MATPEHPKSTGHNSPIQSAIDNSSSRDRYFSSPPFPAHSPHLTSLNQPFSLKLDHNNFILWKTMVSTIVRGHRLHGYLSGTKSCPPEFLPAEGGTGEDDELQINTEYEQWIINDQLLMGWLYSSMSEAIATEVMGSTSAADLWRALENLYGAHSKSKMDDTRTLIQSTRKGSSTMVEYLWQKKNWADILTLAGDPYLVSHLISNVLSGLGIEYISIVTQIEARPSTTWQELQDLLLSFDSKIERLQTLSSTNKATNLVVPQANMVAKSTSTGSSSSRVRGSHFNPNQHNGGRGSNFNSGRGGYSSRSRGRGRGANSRPTCQVCGKYGHSAAICYNRFDESYMGSDPNLNQQQPKTGANAFLATPEILDSDAWFADSGASNHITSDASNMSQKT